MTRLCACGCGAPLDGRRSNVRYIRPSHRTRRWRNQPDPVQQLAARLKHHIRPRELATHRVSRPQTPVRPSRDGLLALPGIPHGPVPQNASHDPKEAR